MKQYGLIKKLKVADDEEIKLCGNALTFILYKSYFGKDLLNDIISFAKKNSNTNTLSKLKEYKIETIEDLEKLDEEQSNEVFSTMEQYQFDREFILNFIASLMATAEYPNKPDVGELIMSIPPNIITDKTIISELLDFFSLFISQKKR